MRWDFLPDHVYCLRETHYHGLPALQRHHSRTPTARLCPAGLQRRHHCTPRLPNRYPPHPYPPYPARRARLPSPGRIPGGTSRHANLDRALCNDELRLSPRVTSLLGRIPYFADGGSGPHDVLVTYGIDPDDAGETWILDTEANTIRRRSLLATPDPDPTTVRRAFPAYAPERPDEPGSYRNAPTVLADYVDALRGLVLLPGWEMNRRLVCFAFDLAQALGGLWVARGGVSRGRLGEGSGGGLGGGERMELGDV